MTAIPRHILVLRFSALGDIAMAVPVIKNLLQQHPSLQVTFVSVPFVKPLFDGIERLDFYGVDIKNDYKGFKGLYNLSNKLKHEIDFDAVADIHDVLRTKILRLFLGKQNGVIDKGRKEKKELTRPVNKILRPLKTGFQRYADVFEKLGYKITLDTEKGHSSLQPDTSLLPGKKDNNFNVGIAPFAKHNAKMYPLDKMEKVVDLLLQDERINLFVFAAKNELPAINNWMQKSNNISLVARKYSLAQELNLISQLDAMISMDSANMHLASLFGVPVISIWGGTHPFLGFYGWGQQYENIVQTEMPCRPSSVFGNKDCPVHGPAGCMQQITPEMICDKTIAVLQSHSL
ncbi:MAG: glycosyltransferase family 9 protein [Ferruginibacter sp.]